MFLQESTGQGREIATREEPPNVGSIISSCLIYAVNSDAWHVTLDYMIVTSSLDC